MGADETSLKGSDGVESFVCDAKELRRRCLCTTRSEAQYKCAKCGKTSSTAGNCCGAPMKEAK